MAYYAGSHSNTPPPPPWSNRPPLTSPTLTTSSWGTNPAPKLSSQGSSAPTVYSFGVPSHFSWPSSPAASSDSGSSESSYGFQIPRGSWPAPFPMAPPSPYSSASAASLSSPPGAHGYGSHTHVHGNSVPSPTALSLNPALVSKNSPYGPFIDFGYPPSMNPGRNYLPGASESAFRPPTSSMLILFAEQPRWSVRVCTDCRYAITVLDVVNHIYNYLCLPDTDLIDDAQLLRAAKPVDNYMVDRKLVHGTGVPPFFHREQRRVDILAGKHVFVGLIPANQGKNSWFVCLNYKR